MNPKGRPCLRNSKRSHGRTKVNDLPTHFPNWNSYHLVLTDPNRRAVYDLLGEEGLKTKWDIGPKYKTAEEASDCFP